MRSQIFRFNVAGCGDEAPHGNSLGPYGPSLRACLAISDGGCFCDEIAAHGNVILAGERWIVLEISHQAAPELNVKAAP